MSQEFDKCVNNGGKITTQRVNKTQYAHFCTIGGKVIQGEVKNYKKLKGKIAVSTKPAVKGKAKLQPGDVNPNPRFGNADQMQQFRDRRRLRTYLNPSV